MNRIDEKFRELKKNGKKALIMYLMAGDPSLSKTKQLVLEFEKAGVDLIELGVPFSDPLADGPVIQEAAARSLKQKTNLRKIISLVADIRKESRIPMVFMSYFNPILQYGIETFIKDASACGIDGVIIPDLPFEEAKSLACELAKRKLCLINLLAPTSSLDRIKRVSKASRGFVYYVSLAGVTGMRRQLPRNIKTNILAVKKVSKIPVCVGFGISLPEQAKSICQAADGVIIGSAVVKALAAHPAMPGKAFTRQFVRPFCKALGKESLCE